MSESITIQLPVPLTDAEKTELGQYLTGRLMRLKALEEEKKQEFNRIKTEMEAEQTEVDIVATAIYKGAQERPVNCQIQYNCPEPGWLQIIRTDTMTLVTEREMSKKDYTRAAELAQMGAE